MNSATPENSSALPDAEALYEGLLRQLKPQVSHAAAIVGGFVEESLPGGTFGRIDAMTAKRYSTDTVDEALGALVTENKITRESWGNYVFGGKKSKASKETNSEESDVA